MFWICSWSFNSNKINKVKLDQLSKEEFQKQTEIEKDLINFNVWDIAFKIAYKKAEENIKSSKTYNKGIQKYEKAILQNKSLEEKILFQHNINIDLYLKYFKDFIELQMMLKKTYPSLAFATTHFNNWINFQLKKKTVVTPNNSPLAGKL